MSDELRSEIERRRANGDEITTVSEYVRGAVRVRFQLEDEDQFDDIAAGGGTDAADAPADD